MRKRTGRMPKGGRKGKSKKTKKKKWLIIIFIKL